MPKIISLDNTNFFETISGLWKGAREPFVKTNVLRSTNFRLDGILDYDDCVELDVEERHFNKRKLEIGDIIVERSGGGPKQPVGRVGLFLPPDTKSYCASNFTSILRVKDKNAFDPGFVSLFLQSLYQTGSTESLQRATTGIRNLDWAEYLKFGVPKIPLETQEMIFSLLDKVRKSYILESKQIAISQELKYRSMVELFTRGLRHERQKESEAGLIPENWKVIELVKLLNIKHGFAFQGEFFRAAGDYILLTPGHFNEEGGFRDQNEKTKFYVGKIPEGYILKPDDLLLAMTEQKHGLLGSAALIPKSGLFLHNQRLGLVTNFDQKLLDRKFLYHFFNTPRVRAEIARGGTGTKVRHTSPQRILNISIGLPPIGEQREIARILDSIDQKTLFHKQRKASIEGLFKSLLHKLMSNEIDISVLDLSAFKNAEKAA